MEHQKAITDLIDFIAEFELWLEGECGQLNSYLILYDNLDIRRDTLNDVLDKYREFKKRIEYGNDE